MNPAFTSNRRSLVLLAASSFLVDRAEKPLVLQVGLLAPCRSVVFSAFNPWRGVIRLDAEPSFPVDCYRNAVAFKRSWAPFVLVLSLLLTAYGVILAQRHLVPSGPW